MKTELYEILLEEAVNKLENQFHFGDCSFVNEETDEFDAEMARAYAEEMIAENPESFIQDYFNTNRSIEPKVIEAANDMFDISVYLQAKKDGLDAELKHPEETKKLLVEKLEIDEALLPYYESFIYNYDLEGSLWLSFGSGLFHSEAYEEGYPSWEDAIYNLELSF